MDGALNGLDIELGFVAFTQVPLPDCSHVSGEFRPRDSICPQDFDQDFVLLTAVRYPAMPPPPGAKKMPSFQLVQAFEVYWATRKVWLKAPHRSARIVDFSCMFMSPHFWHPTSLYILHHITKYNVWSDDESTQGRSRLPPTKESSSHWRPIHWQFLCA